MPMPVGLNAPPGADWFQVEFATSRGLRNGQGRSRSRSKSAGADKSASRSGSAPESSLAPGDELSGRATVGQLDFVGPCWTRVPRGPEAARESLEEALSGFSFVGGWFSNAHDEIRANLLSSRGFSADGGEGARGEGGGAADDDAGEEGAFMSIDDAIRMANEGGPQSASCDKGPTSMYG